MKSTPINTAQLPTTPGEEKPAVTVTVLIFSVHNDNFQIVLCKRTREPFKNEWMVPGGLIKIDESLEDAALRILEEKTGIRNVFLEQLYAFGDPKRDPRERRIAIAYYALLPFNSIKLAKDGVHPESKWFPVKQVPHLAFDHNNIIEYAKKRVCSKITYTNVAQSLLPEKFTLSQLQKIYEVILEESLDKRNFRKKMKSLDLLTSLSEKQIEGRHRPAQLYTFKTKELVTFD